MAAAGGGTQFNFAATGFPQVGNFGATTTFQPAGTGGTVAVAPVSPLPELPHAFDLKKLESLEAALNAAWGEGLEGLEEILGKKCANLRTDIIEPFLKGFETREAFGDTLDEWAKSNATQAQPAATAQPSHEQAKKIAEKFSYDQVLAQKAGRPGFRTVAQNFEAEFVKVGLGNLKGKEICSSYIEPRLKLATEVATELRENLARCLHLVLDANQKVGDDTNSIKEEAVNMYFLQQRQVLVVICLFFTKAQEYQDAMPNESCLGQDILVCKDVLFNDQLDLCARVSKAVKYSMKRWKAHAKTKSPGAPSCGIQNQIRKGIDLEMRSLCEVLYERLRCTVGQWPEKAVDSVLTLYIDMQQDLEEASNIVHADSSEDIFEVPVNQCRLTRSEYQCLLFFGTMLASGISYAILEWGRGTHQDNTQKWRDSDTGSREKLVPKLSEPVEFWNQYGGEPLDANGHSVEIKPPCIGYIQLVLACIPQLDPTTREKFLELALQNQALTFLDKDMLVCSTSRLISHDTVCMHSCVCFVVLHRILTRSCAYCVSTRRAA